MLRFKNASKKKVNSIYGQTWGNTIQNFSTYLTLPITTWTQLLNRRENLIDVWNWFLWCGNEIQVLSHVFLKKSTSYAVTPEVTEINDRKHQKTTSCIFSQRTIMTQNSWKRKSLKKLQVQTRVKNYFSF